LRRLDLDRGKGGDLRPTGKQRGEGEKFSELFGREEATIPAGEDCA